MRALLVVLASIALAPAPSLAQSAPAAAQSESIRDWTTKKLLLELRERKWAKREAAALELVRRGAPVLPDLARAQSEPAVTKTDGLGSLIASIRLNIAMTDASVWPTFVDAILAGESEIPRIALSVCAGDPTEACIEALSKANPSAQQALVNVLGMRRARAAIPAVRALLASKEADLGLRWRAAWALGMIGATDDESVALLEACVNDPDPNVAALSVWSLAKAGARGIPGLWSAMENATVRPDAGARLTRIEGAGPAILERISASQNVGLVGHGLRILACTPWTDAKLEDFVARTLAGETKLLRVDALRWLRAGRMNRERAVELLRKALTDTEEAVAAAAAETIGCLELEVVQSLKHDLFEAWRRKKSIPGIDAFHAEALSKAAEFFPDQVVAVLEAALADEHKWTKETANLLSRFGAPAVPLIRDAWKAVSKAEKEAMLASALAKLGEEGHSALVELAAGPDGSGTVVRALGESGRCSPRLLEILAAKSKSEMELPDVLSALVGLPAEAGPLRLELWSRRSKLSEPQRVQLLLGMSMNDYGSPKARSVLAAVLDGKASALEKSVALVGYTRPSVPLEERRRAGTQALREVVSKQRALERLASERDEVMRRRSGKWVISEEKLEAEAQKLESPVFSAGLALSRGGDPGKEAIDLLVQLLSNSDDTVVLLAELALKKIGPHAASAAVPLARLFDAKEAHLAAGALDAAAELGTGAADITTSLGCQLVQHDADRAERAGRALGGIGSAARLALPFQAYLLLLDEIEVCSFEFSTPKKHFMASGPWRIEGRPNAFEDARVLAAAQLGAIGAQYPELAPAVRAILERVVSDPDAVVARAAADARSKLP